ncbi:MAG: sensor histidine kinase [Acidobacteriota bacterium]
MTAQPPTHIESPAVLPAEAEGQRVLLPPAAGSRRRRSFVLALVMFLGVGVSALATNRAPWIFYAAVFAIASASTLLSLRFGEGRWASPSRLQVWGFFAIQFGLAGALALLLAQQRVFGASWLIFMPLISQGRIYLRPWGTAAVVLISLTIVGAHVYILGGWREVPTAILSISAAVVFVLLFTDIALREVEARMKTQRLSDELMAANRRLAEFAVEAEELAAERERSRLAREIHDSVGHYLTVVHVQLEAAKTLLDHDPTRVREALGKAQGLTQQGLSEIRRSVASLRASPLAGRKLEEALRELVTGLESAGLVAELQILGRPRTIDSGVALTLYRTAQEGLTNVRKHSQARRVDVSLDYRDAESVRLEVRDDGVGAADPSGGFGLLGVQERVRQVAGQVDIVSEPEQGLALRVEIPS